MKDVAKVTGFSLATISRVFNGSDLVTDKTRAIVLEAAKSLNYRPNKMAAALRSGKSKTIGVVVPVISRDVFVVAIKSIEEVLRKAGYHIIICQSHESYEKEKDILENLKQLRVDGVIISLSNETSEIEHLRDLMDAEIPMVLFDRKIETGDFNSVVIDNYDGAYQATSHLVEQGCRKIIHLAGKDTVSIFSERRRGFEAALREHGLPILPQSSMPFNDDDPCDIKLLSRLLQSNDRPDAIFANGDIAALVALNLLTEMGVKVPEEVAVIGFGNNLFCSHLQPSLSSISQSSQEVGKMAAELLLWQLQSPTTVGETSQKVLPIKLIIRQSSARTSKLG